VVNPQISKRFWWK